MVATLALALPACVLASSPKIPDDAPTCAPPGTIPIFLSLMGEPFRGTPGLPYASAVWFAGADMNKDGLVGRDEVIADAARFFATLDKDHDGRLTPDEIDAYERDVAPETSLFTARDYDYGRSRRSRREAGVFGRSADYGGPMGAGRYAWLNIPEPVVAADLDINRVVTAAEFATAAAAGFDRIDIMGRGKFRLSDLPRTPAQIAIEGPCRPPAKRKHRDGDDVPG